MLYIRVKFPAYVQLRTWCQVWNHTNVNWGTEKNGEEEGG
jgi:hypothetical protein